MKRRPRILPDQTLLLVVPPQPAEPLLFSQSADGAGPTLLDGPTPEMRPPGTAIGVLPTGRTLCRTVELPDAADTQLATALRLQIDTLQLGSLPAHRTGLAVLPRELSSAGRLGMSTEWPAGEPAPSMPRDLPPESEVLFASDAPALLALLQTGLQGPLVSVSEDRRAITFVMRAPRGVVVRCSRVDPADWPGSAEAAVLESALRAGADEAGLRGLLAPLRRALERAGEGGMGCTESDLAALAARVGVDRDAGWWRTHGLAVGTALAWFGPLRPLVSLRTQPPGERAGRLGEWLNRLAEPALATRLLVAAILTIALAPPIISGTRLLILRWKIGDLAERERANTTHRQRVALYGELQRRAWPMGKLLGDLACVTPEGIDWTDITLSRDRNISLQGFARPHDGMNGTEVLLKMESQMRDSRIFDKVQRKWDAPDGKGAVRFQISASVARATQRPNYPIEQDFGRKTLAERRYGPEKPEKAESDSSAAVTPPDPASLPPETELASAETPAPPTEPPAAATEKPAVVGKKAGLPSAKPSAKPVKSERKGSGEAGATAAASTAGEAGAESEGTADGDGKAGRSRRGTPASSSGTGLARRGERTPGSADEEFKPPPPLSDAQIEAMSGAELKAALAKVGEARQRVPKDSDDWKRLKAEFDKLMTRLRTGGGS